MNKNITFNLYDLKEHELCWDFPCHNMGAAVELVETYEKYSDPKVLKKLLDEHKVNPYHKFFGYGAFLSEVTGFGSTASCTLCSNESELSFSNENCHKCIHKVVSPFVKSRKNMYCLVNHTYNMIEDARDAYELSLAFKLRASYIKSLIRIYCDRNKIPYPFE